MDRHNKHILVVDDDIDLALTYQELLQAHDYQASTAADGREALKMLKSTKVDAILCDLDMPELAGDLFYREVGLGQPQLLKRLIFISANTENPLYETFLAKLRTPVLAKPVTMDRVLETLESVLAN